MKLSQQIGGGFLVLTILVFACGGVGYYGVDRLSESLNYVTGPAWNAADGSMEGSIGVEAQIIAINSIFSKGDEKVAMQRLESGRAMEEDALTRMIASDLLSADQVSTVVEVRKKFAIASREVLEKYKSFAAVHEKLTAHFYDFQTLMTIAEVLGDGSVEELESRPDEAITWNTGLERKWTAADGTMESQIGMLQRIYFYERLISFEDEKDSIKNLGESLKFLNGAIAGVIDHPLFKETSIPEGKFNGQKYSPVLKELLAQNIEDFNEAVEKFVVYKDARIQYIAVSDEILETLEEIEEVGDSTVEGEVGAIQEVIRLSDMTIIVVTLFAVLIAMFMGIVIIRTVNKQLGAEPARLAGVALSVSEGDLTLQTDKDAVGVYASISNTVEKLVEIISGIKSGANEVGVAAEQVSQGNANLSQRTQEQASSLEEVASSMEEMTSTVNQNAENAQQANQLASSARSQADAGGKIVIQAISAMKEINDSSKQIADIIGVIDEIAFQTNLLALNAAVEAARAGEQGRGFAVVASEVRNLAGRSATAAKEIKTLIKDSVEKVEDGTRLVDESGTALEEIVNSVKKVSDIIGEIAAASQEQSDGIGQVNTALLQMDETTQQNAALVEEASAASEAMGAQAQELTALVAYFKINGSAETSHASQRTLEVSHKPTNGGGKSLSHMPATSLPQVRTEDVSDESKWQDF